MSLVNDWIARGRTALAADQVMLAKAADIAGDLAVNLVVAGLILAGSIFLSRWAGKAVRTGFARLHATRHDKTLPDFFSQVTRWAVLIIGLVMVLQRLGVQTTSIIAVLGAASLAVGLALQGTLSNVAAGVMLLVLRPYRVGDQLEMQDHLGTVQKLDLFNTELRTPDGRKIVVPNSKALSDTVVNRSGYEHRRVDLVFDIHYDTRIDHAFDVIRRVAAADPRVLTDPPLWVGLTGLMDSSMQVSLFAWVRNPDWWDTKADLMKAVKEAFDAEAIEIPYPHQVEILPKEIQAHLMEDMEGRDEGGRAN